MIDYSIIICTYNQKNTLSLILASLKTQITQPKSFEIVIADDHSTDGTDEYVRQLRYPIFLKYSRSDKNKGRAVNRNRGFEKASGKKIICIDGDMVPGPGFIEAHFKSWEEFPAAVILGGRRPWPGQETDKLIKYLYSRGRLPMIHGAKLPERLFTSDNFSMDKKIFARLNGFDTAFENWGGEDIDFGLRLKKAGIPIHYVPEAFCCHHHHKTLDEMSSEFERFGQSGFPLLARKYPDELIYRDGWIFGLPDARAGIAKRTIARFLLPFTMSPSLQILTKVGNARWGMYFNNFLYDWLLYGHLANGYRRSKK